ncbi:MAG: SDR family NAD(P)-dependent oxidoreductase [Burkholderiales bacterium]
MGHAFQDRSGKVLKRFYVRIDASWTGNAGDLLDEHFLEWSDGKKTRRIWTVTKLDDHRYSGTAADVIGSAAGTAYGNALRWRYVLNLETDDGKTYEVDFDDWMYLIDERTMLNRSYMGKFGFELGQVTLPLPVAIRSAESADLRLARPPRLIIGASSGIGEATARTLLERGACAALSACSQAPLQAMAAAYPEHSLVLPLDITAIEQLRAARGEIEGKRAGHRPRHRRRRYTSAGAAWQLDAGRARALFEVNPTGVATAVTEIVLVLLGQRTAAPPSSPVSPATADCRPA